MLEEIRERNVETVLREAERLFAQEGVEKTSLGKIAEAAHITRRSVQNYFVSRNALIKAVLDRHLLQSSRDLETYLCSPACQCGSGLEQYLHILSFVLGTLRYKHEAANSMTEMALLLRRAPDPADRPDYTTFLRPLAEKMGQALRRGQADGSVRTDIVLSGEFMDMLTLTHRGLYRQLAYNIPEETAEKLAFAKQLTERYLCYQRSYFENPAARR